MFSVVISVSKLPYRMHKFLAERATDALFCLYFRRGSFSFHCAPIICDRKRPRWRGWSGSWRRMRGGEQYPSVPPGERNKGDDSAVRDSKQTSSLGLLGLWRRGLLVAFLHQPSPFLHFIRLFFFKSFHSVFPVISVMSASLHLSCSFPFIYVLELCGRAGWKDLFDDSVVDNSCRGSEGKQGQRSPLCRSYRRW